MKVYLAIGFVLLVAGFYLLQSRLQRANASVPPKTVAFLETSPSQDAWYDVRFATTVEPRATETRILHLRNRYEDQPVGLDVSVQGSFRMALKLDDGSARVDF